jgi:virginiamycin A acetyltransferase
MSTVPDPTKVHWPEMIDNQERNTAFLKWIGREAVVMPGVTVGDGAIIGARAVVVSDVAPYTTVGGNPARPLKKRYSDEDVDRLLRIAWLNWPVDAITKHARTIWTGTPAELEQEAKDAGLLD